MIILELAKITKADGCHLGQKDDSILISKKYLKKQNYWNNLPQFKIA